MSVNLLKKTRLSFICILIGMLGYTQNEASKWHFGVGAGLDFMTTPPVGLLNGSTHYASGSAAISDFAGNLLFYSDGSKIWNKQHMVMQNGILTGDAFLYRTGPAIVKLPGNSSIYYIFTIRQDSTNLPARLLNYSIIDMTLDGGLGAVTNKNVLVYNNTTEKTAVVKHCNNSDYWIISHDYNSNNFRANLLTPSGLSTLPVLSPIGMFYNNIFNVMGDLKASPYGNKLGNAIRILNGGQFEVFDFDRTTGIVSNQLQLGTYNGAQMCEFSADASKFYGTALNDATFWQWDLCAGSSSAIVNSVYTQSVSLIGALQLAVDGKIYVNSSASTSLSVINAPNLSGSACGFSYNVQSIATGTCSLFLVKTTSSFLQPSFTFTSGLSCQTASFSAPPSLGGCAAAGTPSLASMYWIFGDNASGASNTSTLTNPTHVFSAPGSYTVKLVLDYNTCVADTMVKVVSTATLPVLNVSGNLTLCPNTQASLTVSGADSYTWSNGANTASVILNPSTTTTYTISGTNTTTACFAAKIITVTSSPCTFVSELTQEKLLVNVYPNPFQNFLSVQLQKKAKVILIDVFGKVLFTNDFNEGETRIDLSDYPNSIYILKIQSKKNTSYIKILKTD